MQSSTPELGGTHVLHPNPNAQVLRSKMVRAGAGAGKTTALTQFVIESAKEFKAVHGRFPQVVVTTFTRKATQELRERLIRKASSGEDRELLEFVSSKSQMLISTIHGVLNLFLKRYGHLMDLDPNFSLLTSPEENRLVKGLLRDYFLNQPEALKWLETFDLAGITKMVLQMGRYRKSLPDLRAIYRDDLEADFSEHIQRLADDGAELAASLLETTAEEKFVQFAEKLKPLCAKIRSMTPATFPILAPDVIEDLPNKPQYRKEKSDVTPELDGQLRDWMARLRDTCSSEFVSPARWEDRIAATAEMGGFLQDVSAQFEALKVKRGLMSMDDLELTALQAQRQTPALTQNFAEGFDLWLVDEFQDTSPLQVEILRGFMGDRPRFVVGDPQQSIYLFRGARSEVFESYSQEMTAQAARIEVLSRNYRSKPELLSFFNDVFSRMGSQFVNMQTRTDVTEPQAVVATISQLATDEDEQRAVVARIQQLLHHGAGFSDICVLGRTNKDLQALALATSAAGLPVYLHQTQGFFQRREIQDALAILKFLCHPYDNENVLEILRSPWAFVSDAKLTAVLQSRPGFFFSALCETLPEEPAILKLKSLRETTAALGLVEGFNTALREWGFFERALALDPTGRMESNLWKLLARLKEEIQKPGFLMLDFLTDEQAVRDLDLGDEEGDAVSALEPNRINFMTVHASKGLQFKNVLLARIGQRLRQENMRALMLNEDRNFFSIPWPENAEPQLKGSLTELKILQAQRQREAEENLRVLYVALTRAQESVHLFSGKDPQRNSWAEHLQWLLEKGPGVHQLQNCAVEVLYEPLDVAEFKSASAITSTLRPRLETQVRKQHRRISVTELIKGDRGNETRTVNPQILALAKKGVGLHRAFESLRFQPDQRFDDPKMQEAVDYVYQLTEPPMKQLLQTGNVEWGFQIQTPSGLLQGQMDLMGEIDGVFWIIDYKSGSKAGEALALSQLQVYGWCLQQRFPDQKIMLAAVFPFERMVSVVPYSPERVVFL